MDYIIGHRSLLMGILAALISSAAYLVYIVEFMGGRTKTHPLTRWMWRTLGLKGDTRPRLITWVIWMSLTCTTVIINVRDGSTSTAILCGLYFFGNAALLVASVKCGTWNLKWYDFICLALGVIALVLLFREDSPRAATALIILADTIAGIPTFASVIRKPEAESRVAWRIFFVGSLVNVFAFAHPLTPSAWGGIESAYTLYVIACTTYMVTMTTFQRRYRLEVTYEILRSASVHALPGGAMSIQQDIRTETETIGFLTRWGRRRYLRNALDGARVRSGTDEDESLDIYLYGDD